MYNHHEFRDQDFYCSFTHLPNTCCPNLDALPHTIHTPSTIARLRPPTMRPDSFDSAYGSLLSSSSSLRKRKLLAKMKQLFRAGSAGAAKQRDSATALVLMRAASRKPSTLDFRCIGTGDGLRSQHGSLDMAVYDAPKIQWREPRVADGWGEGWFDRVAAV